MIADRFRYECYLFVMPFSKPDKTFYFIRHGVTAANIQKLWCGGDWDIELHPDGEAQANALADRIRDISREFDRIFHSPMLRAQQTARLVNEKALKPVEAVEDLREWRIGVLERTPWAEPLLSKPVDRWPSPDGGESVIAFRSRVRSALTHCLKNSERPLLVSHGAVCRMILDLLGVSEQHIPNCTLYKFSSVFDNGSTIWKISEY